jgi:hypothetical protein
MEVGILGDLVVLAVFAVEIAAHCGNGIGKGTGQQMKDGLFFDGVDVFADQATVVEAVEDSAPILPDLADSSVAFTNQTVVAAEQAADMSRVVSGLGVKECFVHGHLPRQSAFAYMDISKYTTEKGSFVLIHKRGGVVNKKKTNLFQWITVFFNGW